MKSYGWIIKKEKTQARDWFSWPSIETKNTRWKLNEHKAKFVPCARHKKIPDGSLTLTHPNKIYKYQTSINFYHI